MSKFYVWIDNPTSTSCMTSDAFNSDSQRQIGFQSGKPASAIRINTAIRQANLIAVALVNALNITDDKSVMTSLNDMTNWFKGLNLFKLDSLFTVGIGNVQTTLNKSIQPNDNDTLSLGLDEYRFANIFVNKFNNNNVVDIFETNGTTVKKATNAEYATYASNDTSKGTIEERLTHLGFKRGSIIIGGRTINLYRQGNYVLVKADNGLVVGSTSLPNGFVPEGDRTLLDINGDGIQIYTDGYGGATFNVIDPSLSDFDFQSFIGHSITLGYDITNLTI